MGRPRENAQNLFSNNKNTEKIWYEIEDLQMLLRSNDVY